MNYRSQEKTQSPLERRKYKHLFQNFSAYGFSSKSVDNCEFSTGFFFSIFKTLVIIYRHTNFNLYLDCGRFLHVRIRLKKNDIVVQLIFKDRSGGPEIIATSSERLFSLVVFCHLNKWLFFAILTKKKC